MIYLHLTKNQSPLDQESCTNDIYTKKNHTQQKKRLFDELGIHFLIPVSIIQYSTFLVTFGPPSAFLSTAIHPADIALLKPTLALGPDA